MHTPAPSARTLLWCWQVMLVLAQIKKRPWHIYKSYIQYDMKFEWDENKRRENIRKHGIDFHDVPMVFDGPMLVRLDTRTDYGEEDRWIGNGFFAGCGNCGCLLGTFTLKPLLVSQIKLHIVPV